MKTFRDLEQHDSVYHLVFSDKPELEKHVVSGIISITGDSIVAPIIGIAFTDDTSIPVTPRDLDKTVVGDRSDSWYSDVKVLREALEEIMSDSGSSMELVLDVYRVYKEL